MKVVIDTNVVISGTFFGGLPRKIIEAVSECHLNAYATDSIIREYDQSVLKVIHKNLGDLQSDLLASFVRNLIVIPAVSVVDICRDPDDNKFLSCAKDAKALYIISGDKDLLTIGKFEGIEIVTVTEFCARYLDSNSVKSFPCLRTNKNDLQ